MKPVQIDRHQKLGDFKPINGICNGPVCFGSLIDSSQYFKQAGFPFCRLHDMNFPHAREVDIPAIFPNYDADADNPASYDFRATDIYLEQVEAVGAKIIFRFGVAIEHGKYKFFTHPPKDFAKWAEICLHIVKHYNEGWADGYHKNIIYWEVWNEPDHLADNRNADAMWSGTPEQYYALYGEVARLIKHHIPYVKIGGYGSTSFSPKGRLDFFINFLKYVRDNKLPLDFFSWHVYTSQLDSIRNGAKIVREQLDRHGFTETESILDEWNFLLNRNVWDILLKGERALERREVLLETSGTIGASFTAAALIEMANLPIDIATFYDGQPINFFCTIFDRFGVPTKQFYAFEAYNELVKCGGRISAECDIPGVYALAAASDTQICVFLSNWDGNTAYYPIELLGLRQDARYTYTLYRLDEWRDFTAVETRSDLKAADLPDIVYLHSNSAAFIRVTENIINV